MARLPQRSDPRHPRIEFLRSTALLLFEDRASILVVQKDLAGQDLPSRLAAQSGLEGQIRPSRREVPTDLADLGRLWDPDLLSARRNLKLLDRPWRQRIPKLLAVLDHPSALPDPADPCRPSPPLGLGLLPTLEAPAGPLRQPHPCYL